MLRSIEPHRAWIAGSVLAMLAIATAHAVLGEAKPVADWHWIDIAGEGGTALMCAVWMSFMLGARPGGRVTALLASGLCFIMLAQWADCMDEFFALADGAVWDNVLEGVLMPAGVFTLTIGLYYWREEQRVVSASLRRRERLFRDHRALDRVTDLAGTDYLMRQITLERARRPDRPCALALIDLDAFHRVNRAHGRAEGDRVLSALAHLVLLNLRADDLLCRYAGDRFVLLLPDADLPRAERLMAQLTRVIAAWRYHVESGDQALAFTARSACAPVGADPVADLRELNRRIDARWCGALPA